MKPVFKNSVCDQLRELWKHLTHENRLHTLLYVELTEAEWNEFQDEVQGLHKLPVRKPTFWGMEIRRCVD